MTSPKEAVLGVTWRCNSRCKICDIWSRNALQELPPEAYKTLPDSLRQVSLGGYGEPFLRRDLHKIVQVIRERCPKARIVIVTNGFTPHIILNQVKKMPKDIAIRVSLDGIGPVHDEVRGVKGGYEKAVKTIILLRENGIQDLGVGFVINKLNESEIEKVFDSSQKNRMSFACTIVQTSDITFGEKDNYFPHPGKTIHAIEGIMDRLLRTANPKDWATAYFLDGIRYRLIGESRKIRCVAGKEFFYMNPSGNIYPCNILAMKMGTMNNGFFPSLHQGNARIHDYVAHCPRQCWMTCTVTPAMRKRPLKPILWILKSRLFGYPSIIPKEK